MGKYEPLARFLKEYRADACETSFAEIEEALGFSLPPSARKHRAWWANQFKGHHSQAKAWIDAGWEVVPSEIDLVNEKVRFVRTREGGRSSDSRELEALRRTAMQFSGIEDREDLEKAALQALIRRQAEQALIDLGGSDPHATAPGRRRFT